MAHFYLDYNVRKSLASLLQERGHSATTVRDLGLPRAGDEEHLLIAAERRWIVVTHNRDDFLLLHRAWRRWSTAWGVMIRHAGIVVIPQSWSSARSAEEIERLISLRSVASGEVHVWRPSHGWLEET